MEGLMAYIFKEVLGITLALPFRVLTYDEAMNHMGLIKWTRFGMELRDVTEALRGSSFQCSGMPSEEGIIKAINVKEEVLFRERRLMISILLTLTE